MQKYETETFEFEKLKDQLSLPKYQRSYVWQESKKLKLISTIKRGLPVGTVLLSEKDGKYLIADGLQRIATLKDYQKEPLKYLEDTEITDQDIIEILKSSESAIDLYGKMSTRGQKETRNDAKELIIESIKKFVGLEIYEKTNKITEVLINRTSLLNQDAQMKVHSKVYKLLDKINNILDIDKYEIPAIIFTGSDDELVEVFTLLNSTGTSLSKYDVFSAKWNSITIPDVDDETLDAVLSKYETSMGKSGIEIDDFSPISFKAKKEITLFEYAYAIGKIIGDKTKKIFKSKDDDVVDSLGFSLLAGVFNIPNKEMHNLASKVPGGDFDYNELKNTLVTSAKRIEEELDNYISRKKKNYAAHSELQLASYIITYHRLQYEITDVGVQRTRKYSPKLKEFCKHLPTHYMYDVYRKAWSGSGDTKLDNLVIDDKDEEFNSTILSSAYMFTVNKADFKATLNTWINDENQKDRTTISKEVKLFHNCMFKNRPVRYQSTNKDYEHIVPKKRFEDLKNGGNIRIPISSPCNITLIPEYDNRAKKEKTYYEYAENPGGVVKIYSSDELEQYNYPSRESLEFIHNKALKADEYMDFIEMRHVKIVDDFMAVIYG